MTKNPHAFVTGYPIQHSRSPIIHRYWLKTYQLHGYYDPVETTPENFVDFIHNLKKNGFCGGNVTLPHKEQAFALADIKDEMAATIGAANTLWFEDGKLYASNSDIYGFTANMDDHADNWVQDTALVLGAGGASRAVIYALQMRGYKNIIIVNRTKERADALVQHFGKPVVAGFWEKRDEYVRHADLIINTTSLGMEKHGGDGQKEKTIAFEHARPHALVTDIVYTPLITPFLNEARQKGLKTIDGLGMLLHQAVPGFEKWFGIKPAVTPQLRALVLADMGIKDKE